jgi:hypothetical protein
VDDAATLTRGRSLGVPIRGLSATPRPTWPNQSVGTRPPPSRRGDNVQAAFGANANCRIYSTVSTQDLDRSHPHTHVPPGRLFNRNNPHPYGPGVSVPLTNAVAIHPDCWRPAPSTRILLRQGANRLQGSQWVFSWPHPTACRLLRSRWMSLPTCVAAMRRSNWGAGLVSTKRVRTVSFAAIRYRIVDCMHN